MKTSGRILTAAAIGYLLVAGVPFAGTAVVLADPGCGCECGYPKNAGEAGPMHRHGMGMQDNTMGGGGHMHRHGGHMGGHPGMRGGMPDAMDAHMKGMRDTITRLRAVEARMEAMKEKDDAGFRAASLEHGKLLTDLQENHLKHMEGMMEMHGSCGGMKK
jgi:hypothetical protein